MINIVKELREEEEKYTNQLRDIREKINQIQDSCIHKVVRNTYDLYDPVTRKKTGKTTPGDGVENCPKCDYNFGSSAWWCPVTEGICDYEGQDTYHLVCKNCGMPEERK